MEIHHYTKASTLPLILQSGKLRFTRADRLDDLAELPFEAFHLSREAFFINSWVKSTVETSGQWFRYADQHRGVCLSFGRSPFPYTKLRLSLNRQCLTKDGESRTVGIRLNRAPAPFNRETMFGKGYVLIPWADDECFGGDVIYAKDPQAYVKQFLKSTPDKTEITGGSELARIKAMHWNDQSEYRFTLMAFQGPDLVYKDNPDRYEDELLSLMELWQASGGGRPTPDVTFIDLPIDARVLDCMTVRLGSRISAEDREAVMQALQRYAPNAKVLESLIQAR